MIKLTTKVIDYLQDLMTELNYPLSVQETVIITLIQTKRVEEIVKIVETSTLIKETIKRLQPIINSPQRKK